MNKKALTILVIILAGALAYVIFTKQAPQAQNNPQTPPVSQTPPTEPPVVVLPPSLPATCIDEQEGVPVITALSSSSGPVGIKLEISGCNFAGFEGDKNAWIENSQGVKGFLHAEDGSTAKLIKVILKSPLCQKDTSYSGMPCDASLTLAPGAYKIYVTPWGKKSNEADFMIQ